MRYMQVLKRRSYEDVIEGVKETVLFMCPAEHVTSIISGQHKTYLKYRDEECCNYLTFKRSETYVVFRDLEDVTI